MDIHPVCDLPVSRHAAALTGGGPEATAAKMRHSLGFGLAAFERRLGDPAADRFRHGESITVANLCLVQQLYNTRRREVPLTHAADRGERPRPSPRSLL